MKRINTPELLDTDACPPEEVAVSLRDMARINRWFGGVSTTVELVRRAARATGKTRLSLLEVAAGLGELPEIAAQKLAIEGISVNVTLLDRAQTHLPPGSRAVAADALALPFSDGAFDLVSCNLFAHHLEPEELIFFVKEALRVSRSAVLINDIVRHPMHVALVYAGFPLMRSRVSRFDGLASVRRAYLPEEVQQILMSISTEPKPRIEVFRHPLFRMGITIWKSPS
ncbi:MAG TPA: methyltransferase domain-containing protein [Candidatus Sulfotelmatobacter sp.]